MSKSKAVVSNHKRDSEASVFSYSIGFILCIFMTIWAYMAVTGSLSRKTALVIISILAFAQFVTQTFFFLHLGHENKPRWRLSSYLFMIMVVLILFIGSIWIMNNLNYRMTPDQMQKYLKAQDSL